MRNVRAKTLFATHYFELTELAEQLSGVKNYHVSVKEAGGSVVFLRKVEPGAADRSYGIEVAKLAGLPNEVVVRAREVLAEHESAERRLTGAPDARRGARTADPADDLYSAVAASAGEASRSRFESADAAGGAKLAGGVEEGNLTAETQSLLRKVLVFFVSRSQAVYSESQFWCG